MTSRSFGRPTARFTAISLSVAAARVHDVEIVGGAHRPVRSRRDPADHDVIHVVLRENTQ